MLRPAPGAPIRLLLRLEHFRRLDSERPPNRVPGREEADHFEDVGELAEEPRGTLRLHTSTVAETTSVASLLTRFLTAHPDVQLDLVTSDAPVHIVAEGYDAGIQLGDVIDQDMIAVPVTGELRLAVVGAPS